MPPKNDEADREFQKRVWELAIDTMEKLREEVAGLKIKMAIAETKLAIIAALCGGIGSIVGAVVIWYLKK